MSELWIAAPCPGIEVNVSAKKGITVDPTKPVHCEGKVEYRGTPMEKQTVKLFGSHMFGLTTGVSHTSNANSWSPHKTKGLNLKAL